MGPKEFQSNSLPVLSARTVYLVGNGILRVPSWIGLDPEQSNTPLTTPSWSEYMDALWGLVNGRRREGEKSLPLHEFSRLSAPRQAEWFDREYRPEGWDSGARLSPWELSALRLHLLGVELHPTQGLLTNDLLQRLGKLVANAAAETSVDVFTTNLDCSLEQNIAYAIEQWFKGHDEDGVATVEVMAGFRSSVKWRREGKEDGRRFEVRLWKIHGCLRDLKQTMDEKRWERLRAELGDRAGGRTAISEFCGCLPTAHCLTPELQGLWRAEESVKPADAYDESAGIFTISEYFRSLARVVAFSSGQVGERDEFDRFSELLRTRPLLLLGYSLQEEDVDVVYLLQTTAAGQDRVMLTSDRGWNAGREARLEQMGIRSWLFTVEPAGFSLEPGRLQRVARHEWRLAGSADSSQPWRAAIQRVVALAWLKPQAECLDQLLAEKGTRVDALKLEGRLVFAGLASIWHAFAIRKESDFPTPRRVSAGYTSVDMQVPGGSGLVPCMEAAVMAGPMAAGQVGFLTNVPKAWSSWLEIEEFCLSAGVDVRAHEPVEGRPDLEAGRTSYVLLWDLGKKEGRGARPKQRFIMDVPSLANEGLANAIADPKTPKAVIPVEYQAGEDLLFGDKETEIASLALWKGPLIYETGASGVELLDEVILPDGPKLEGAGHPLRPDLWTSGIGSLVRTLIVATGCLQADAKRFPATIKDVLKVLDGEPRLRGFLESPAEYRERYLAKLVSFEKTPWREGGTAGFLYEDEVAYGKWVLKNWWELGAEALAFLDERQLLARVHPVLGRGILTTVHEGGLMGAWDTPGGGRLLVRVSVTVEDLASGESHLAHAVLCEWRETSPAAEALEASMIATIEIREKMTLRVRGARQECTLGTVARWNTLAAGDTVRGALAYGLWAYLYGYEPKPGGLAEILFASTVLATMKCYAGSFVNFLSLIEVLRTGQVWPELWGAKTSAVEADHMARKA